MKHFTGFQPSLIQKNRDSSHSRWRKVFILAVLSLLFFCPDTVAQYLHRNGNKIVDGNNQEFIIRAMGLGGWMLQEGYMLEMNAFANPQHQIRAKIEEVMGVANTNEFYDAWLKNHCTKRDIDSLAKWGFNSVRLPMHFNLFTLPIEQEPIAGQQTWLEKGFALTDSLVKWCGAHQMYVILDLHATPGGQGNDAAISDYDASKPSLWQSDANKAKTIALWKKLAERYANEKWIGGYDLINETNWNFVAGQNKNGCQETTNGPLRQLFVDITTAIRQVDQNHIIFIEGNCWANNHAGLYPAWDTNMAISFHKYWTVNDISSIQGIVNLRNQFDLPLWMGEAGENSNVWFTSAIRLLEQNGIGWAWWPMKKVGSVVNPLTVVKTENYNTLLKYWSGAGMKPTVEFAKAAMMQLAENLKIENCIYHPDVIDAMFRQVNDAATRPFKSQKAPGLIHLSDFDLGRHNKAYADVDTATHHVTSGSYTAWNNGWTYRNDGVDIEANQDADTQSNRLNIGWTNDNEWTQYTITVDSSAAYNITLRYAASNSTSKIKLKQGSADITPIISLAPTGGNQTWNNLAIPDVILTKGIQKIRLVTVKGGANYTYLKFTLSKKITEAPTKFMSGQTSPTGDWIYLAVNKPIDASTITATTGFTLTLNNVSVTVTEVKVDPLNGSQIVIKTDAAIDDNDILKVSYTAAGIKSTDGVSLENISNLQITNNLPVHITIPGKVEAENFLVNSGLQLENTTDAGGGQNIGYTNAGDYLDYRVRVEESGEYLVELRVASAGAAGKIELQQLNGAGSVISAATINTPVTGGWQTWQTINTKMELTQGSGILKLKVLQPEFNLNWLKFTKQIVSGTHPNRQGSLNIFPNPTDRNLRIEVPDDGSYYSSSICIRSTSGGIVKHMNRVNLPQDPDVYIGDLKAGLYVIELSASGKTWSNKFMKK
jgi:endoglucanase